GGGSKVTIVFLGCGFPILINSYYGMRVVNPEYVELARSFRLSSRALFAKILLPASIPFILAGIRLAIGRAASPASPSPNGSARPRDSAIWFSSRPDIECADTVRWRRCVCSPRNSRLRGGALVRSVRHPVAERSPGRLTMAAPVLELRNLDKEIPRSEH